MTKRSPHLLLLVAALALAACDEATAAPSDEAPDQGPSVGPLPARLSETGLFVAGSTEVRPELLAYAPQYPLWTDGAAKRRWIAVPPGSTIDASDAEAWRFPAGTKLWKEFAHGDLRVETRFMEALAGGTWRYATYRWLDDQSDALRVPAEAPTTTVRTPAGSLHELPSEADCRGCHEARPVPVLGFELLQLSSDRDPNALHGAQPSANLEDLVRLGLLRGLPDEHLRKPPRIDAPTPRARAALGYLHGNCGYCHTNDGELASVGLVLDQPGAGALPSAVDRPSRFRSASIPGATLRIATGDPEASVLALRMGSREPHLRMPPIGSLVVDEEAVALIDAWITEDLQPR